MTLKLFQTNFSSYRTTASAASASHASAPADPQANRRDFLTYALSLMRGHNSEHSDSLPVIDVSAMKHIAYVFDALVYFLRTGNQTVTEEAAAESRASSADDAFAQVKVCFRFVDGDRPIFDASHLVFAASKIGLSEDGIRHGYPDLGHLFWWTGLV